MAVSGRDSTAARAEERAIVEAACGGDAAAFEQLVRRHQMVVYGYFRPRLTEPADADDLCQEVFLRMYQNLAKYNHSVPLRAWLMEAQKVAAPWETFLPLWNCVTRQGE